MTSLELFDYSGQQVRTVLVQGEPWFVLTDLCAVLGIGNPSDVARRLDPDALDQIEVIDSMGRKQSARIVNEAGMYEVVIRSDKPEAVAFRRWITGTVLPAIRKTGSYSVQPELTREQLLAKAVLESADVIKEMDARIVEQAQRIQVLEPSAAAWSHMVAADGDYAVGDAAKVLARDPQITIGRDRLFTFMAQIGWIYRTPGRRGGWRAYQNQIDNGRLTEKLSTPFLNHSTGEYEVPAPTLRVTPKGVDDLRKRLTSGLTLVTA